MAVTRSWVTPVTAGAFLLSAVTGVLMFFHVDSGLNKLAHEWLSWVLLAGGILHVVVNFGGFKRHLASPVGRGLMGLFAVVLALSFISLGQQRREPPFMASVQALSQAPLSTLAQVAKMDTGDLRKVLMDQGLHPASDQQSLVELAGPDVRRRMQLLQAVLTTNTQTADGEKQGDSPRD